ncbi:Aldo/keto reductase [Beauveria brongniartii RCEF 3172]|uniref:Aldo/keto reductase n=1 Tax=Beauveria brongniartii RCEF 3172 TaxID=1081107 RepID=A0A167ACL8_9HYPO|nr:Aldo/keto reductase [Beauveria brongniartii RCEF 3172]
MAATSFKLNTGKEIPSLGLGTWQSKPGEVQTAVSYALQNGYRLVDCAYCYGNEAEVGEGLKEAFAAGIERKDVFIMTKVWATYNMRVEECLDKSLKALGVDFVDMYLIHWPVLMNPNGNDDKFPTLLDGSRDILRDWKHTEAWPQMEALLATGKVRGIGVSNYSKRYLEELLARCTVVPAVNQIENHPSLPQQEIVDLCRARGIHVVAYSPLGSAGSPLLTAAPVVAIAERRSVSPATVLLSYHVARGATVLAKSVTPARIKANADIVKLDKEDMEQLRKYSEDLTAKGELKRYVYPPFGIDFGFPDKS